VITGQLFDVFTLTELEIISKFLDKVPNQMSNGNYHNGFTKDDAVYLVLKKIVTDKLEKLLDRQINLHHGVALNEIKPLGIHTDYFKGDNNSDLSIIIPLINDKELTHTVVFNQSSVTVPTLTDYVANTNNKKLEKNAKDLYNNLCSHISPSDLLEYVSVKGIYQWIPGSVIYFESKLFHCSDNFLANGLERKQAFVIFTTLDNN
jgi:glutathionyl-hydroquinone reductase